MLSILIPLYNYPVKELLSKLSEQCSANNIQFEIICIDDCSLLYVKENESVTDIKGVKFERLMKNIGRSAIRNLLIKKSKYQNILFIDSDMQVNSDQFIRKYLSVLDDHVAVYGGIIYDKEVPEHDKMLRWKYGNSRESIDVIARTKSPHFNARTCNLLIRKDLVENLYFEERIKQYGHEDTLFSVELKRNHIPITHIDNPLVHKGLEDSSHYLHKVKISSESLYFIRNEFLTQEEAHKIKLIRYYELLDKLFLIPLVFFVYRSFRKKIIKNLLSSDPNIRLLDIYKLICYGELDRSKNQATRS